MSFSGPDPDVDALAAASLARGDGTGWFEQLYAAGAQGRAEVPWDRPTPNRLLIEWAGDLDGYGRSALVVGCGLGRDAEFVAGLGFTTTAFDISPTAVATARDRHPGTSVDYRVADLLDPPPQWRHAFDLVVESYTVQALPAALRPRATAHVPTLVAPGGTLLVIAAARAADSAEPPGPPWPLTPAEIDAFGGDGLTRVSREDLADPVDPAIHRWRAVFHRP